MVGDVERPTLGVHRCRWVLLLLRLGLLLLWLLMLRLPLLPVPLLPLAATSAADVGVAPACVVASSCVPPDNTRAAEGAVTDAMMV